jgi:hypothetical protein
MASTPLAAQTTVIQAAPQPGNCPVSLRAQHTPGEYREVVNGVFIPGIAQRIHVVASALNSRRVVAANMTVRGFANKVRVLPTTSGQDIGDAAKKLDVRFPARAEKESSADLAVPDLSAVTAIDLNSVTYADGSVWKVAAGNTCRSWIDGFMLISGR